MQNQNLKEFFDKLLKTLARQRWWERLSSPFRRLGSFITSWWQLLIIVFAAIIFLYYPIGGWMMNKIDTTTDYEINTPPSQSTTVEMMSFLIKREVSDKMWTPNLPFIFPSYVLDNMPNFQLGLMSAVSNVSSSFAAKVDQTIAPEKELPLKTAAELLKYPGTIWMFSPQNKLTPVPSANTQYKKARKQLVAYNRSLREGGSVFYKSPGDLAYFLQRMSKDLWLSNEKLEAHIREHSSDWVDNRSDDLFYYQQGKIYGYYLLMKALSYDYKDIILANDIYQPWTQMVKALEEAVVLSPAVVRNGEPDSTLAPNHLSSIGYYSLKAALISQNMMCKLTLSAAQGKQ